MEIAAGICLGIVSDHDDVQEICVGHFQDF